MQKTNFSFSQFTCTFILDSYFIAVLKIVLYIIIQKHCHQIKSNEFALNLLFSCLQAKLFKNLEVHKTVLKMLHVVFKNFFSELHLPDSGVYIFKGRKQSQDSFTRIS